MLLLISLLAMAEVAVLTSFAYNLTMQGAKVSTVLSGTQFIFIQPC
jgi:hypothetical protein